MELVFDVRATWDSSKVNFSDGEATLRSTETDDVNYVPEIRWIALNSIEQSSSSHIVHPVSTEPASY